MTESDPHAISRSDAPRPRSVVLFLLFPTLLLAVLVFGTAFGIALGTGGGREAVQTRLPDLIPWILAVNHTLVFLALLWQLRREGRGLASVGWELPRPRRLAGEILLGALLAIALYGFDDTILDAVEGIWESAGAPGDGVPSSTLRSVPWAWLFVAAVFPWVEESVYRGWAISRLRIRWPLWAAVLVPTLLFGPLHWGQGLWGMAISIVLGFVLAAIYLWRGNLWAATVAHSGFNAIVILTAVLG